MGSYIAGIVVMVVGLIISVALHELGHLLPAKRFGAIVSKYMVGFGPTLFSRMYRGTEYGVKAILLGGYVSILGMYRKADPDTVVYRDSTGRKYTQAEADILDPSEREGLKPTMAQDAREGALEELAATRAQGVPFTELTWWRKAIVMFGGPLTNAVLAVVCLALAIGVIGYQRPSTTIASVSPCVAASGMCQPGDPVSPAAAAGLKEGDQILSWGGTPVATWDDVRAQIRAGGDRTVDVEVRRGSQTLTLPVTADISTGAPTVGVVSKFMHHRGSIGEIAQATSQVFWGTAAVIVRLPQQVWHTFTDLIAGRPRDGASVMSVVGVARVSGEITSVKNASVTVADRAGALVSLLGSLNMALFVFNLIPLLPLDGGHIVGALYEGIRGRWAKWRGKADPGPVDTARMVPFVLAMWGVLIAMTLVLVAADIVNPVRLG